LQAIDADVARQLVALKDHIVARFNDSHWRELGMLTNHLDQVERHPRLLRSLDFGDDDYEAHLLTMLKKMVTDDVDNLAVITEYVQQKCPEAGEYISSQDEHTRRIVFSPTVFRVPDAGVDYSLVSAMMPFSPSFTSVYHSIQCAASSAGLACKRADDIWDDSTVIQDIFSLIFQSYIVVCDFSEKNPNVFYEAGLAHALGKYVVPITQSPAEIPFDLRHHRYIHYFNNSQGRDDLKAKLEERFRTLARKRGR